MRLGKSRQAWLSRQTPNAKRSTSQTILTVSRIAMARLKSPGCAMPKREVRAVQVASALDDQSRGLRHSKYHVLRVAGT